MKICFCQCTFKRDWNATIKQIENWLLYVDYVIIVVDETVQKNEIENTLNKFNSPVLIIKQVKFNDNIPEFRNRYVEEARKLGCNWYVCCDPDEWINKNTMEDIYELCRIAEEKGYNQIGLNARDQFEPIEWLPFDKLDELKEYPGGYRESNYYKFLINKICCEKFRYGGVGQTKNVHETWYCPEHPRRGVYAPKEKYWYLHIKSAYDIWRNASRNLFISGGGDNVGNLNEMWVELRKTCKEELNVNTWKDFEEYITSNKPLPSKLVEWIKKALTWKATDYGVETRETAKWIIYHHRYLLENAEIRYGVENPPRLSYEDEIETYIRKCYFQVLGRHPDRGGLEFYKQKILKSEVRKEDLPKILASSPEYREKFGLKGEAESVKVQVPIDVNVRLTEELVAQVLMKSEIWNRIFKPRIDLGKFIEEHLLDREKFYTEFYRAREQNNLEFEDLLKLIKKFWRS